MKRLPGTVSVQKVIPSDRVSGFAHGFGLSLDVKPEAHEEMRDELLRLVERPDRENLLRYIAHDYGFLTMNLVLPPEKLSPLRCPEAEQSSREGTFFWHKDGNAKAVQDLGILSSSQDSPRRRPVFIGAADDIFPTISESLSDFLEKTPKAFRKRVEIIRGRLVRTLEAKKKKTKTMHQTLEEVRQLLAASVAEGHINPAQVRELSEMPFIRRPEVIHAHEWKQPETLIISNKGSVVHAQSSVRQRKGQAGKLARAGANESS